MLEDLTVCAQRSVVIDTAGHISPVSRLHSPVRYFLEIKYIKCPFWIGNEVTGAGRAVLRRSRRQTNERADSTNRRHVRTRSQESEKLTTSY